MTLLTSESLDLTLPSDLITGSLAVPFFLIKFFPLSESDAAGDMNYSPRVVLDKYIISSHAVNEAKRGGKYSYMA